MKPLHLSENACYQMQDFEFSVVFSSSYVSKSIIDVSNYVKLIIFSRYASKGERIRIF